MTKIPTIARIWRGRTKPEFADEYESYNRAEGIPPLLKTAIGVQLLREDLKDETWFTTITFRKRRHRLHVGPVGDRR
ncbi:hypothetical protein AB9F35_37140, partial [Rhizobium leguminosarum]|uniref:hypothetical protein n=1 Tax=Rhizobium leguminosarum TaxID=384 RepID=UPI003F97B92F